ncbi:MAG: hypothetical protein OEZ34_16420, partial [Spirochaetia bacterium]|nr:hypothetical protein [Spirochaetia bacterium]
MKTVSSMISEIGENVLDEAQTAKDETTGKPLISKKEGLKRNHANYYFGWEALFGILSYARSDTKRHFRMLPLGWFTWDKASNDRVVLFPPFLPLYFHYNSENLEYRVIFPFYAKQRKGRSYIKSYLFIAFLSEYNEEEDLREYSVLWPFINFYRSPVRNGSRFLPFYHYRSILKDQVRTERLLSPVYFKKKVISYEDTEEKKILSEKSMSISPFHFSSEFKDKIEKRKITAFPVLPLYMKITHDVRLKDQDLDKNFMENPSDSKPEPDEAYYRKKSLTYLFPAFFSTQKVSRSGRKKKQIFFAPFIPLYFKSKVQLYSRENPKQLESEKAIKITPFYSVLESKNAYGETRSTGIPFIPLFGKNERIYYSENNEMPQEKAESAPQTEQASNKKVFRTDHSHYLFPFYYFKRKNFEGKETDQTILLVPILPLYARWNTNAGVSKWMFGLYTFRGYDGLKKNNFLYLAETSSHKDTSAFSMHFLFRSVHYRKDSEQKRFKLLYGILANYRKNKDSGDYQFDALASLYRQKKSSSLFQFHLLPLFYYKKQPERSTLFALGYYSKKRPEYRRRNFLYLYDHEWNGFSKKNRYSFLLGSVRFQKKYNSKNIRLLWGPGMNYSWSSKTKNYNFTALAYLYGQKRTENVFKNYLFPFYYLKNIKNDSKLFMLPYLPVLAYSKTSYGYGFTENDKTKFSKNLYLMGILWYSRQHLFYDENGNLSAQYGNRKHLLLGGIYYNFENFEEKKAKKGILWGAVYGYKRKPLRGYESRGSLWGVLWKYETEKDTGYKKFSILKFLYSDTTKANGE